MLFFLPIGNSSDLFIFVDNTNIFTDAKRTIREREGRISRLYFDYGRLLKVIRGNRKLGGPPVLVGSHPSSNDKLWRHIKYSELGFNMAKTIYKEKPAIMALVISEYGIFTSQQLREALSANWKIELWYWNSGKKKIFLSEKNQCPFSSNNP